MFLFNPKGLKLYEMLNSLTDEGWTTDRQSIRIFDSYALKSVHGTIIPFLLLSSIFYLHAEIKQVSLPKISLPLLHSHYRSLIS